MQLLDEHDVLTMLRAQVRSAGGQTAWAKKFGLRPADINNALWKRRSVSKAALDALGLKRVVRYTYKNGGTAMPKVNGIAASRRNTSP